MRMESCEYQIKIHIYKSEDFSNPINRYLRTLPKRYVGKYELILIGDSLDYKIYRVEDLIYGVPNHSYLIYRKKGNKIIDLMSHNLVVNAIKSGLVNENEVDKYYDLAVNKKEFNKIYKSFDKKSKQIIYSNLLRTSFDSSTYRLIMDKSDIDSVLKIRPKSRGTVVEDLFDSSGTMKENDISIIDYSFLNDSLNADNVIYYWYVDMGLMKFVFKYNNTEEILSVDYEHLGYLGNEISHLWETAGS